LADDPSLTWRDSTPGLQEAKRLRRVVLDSQARTPLTVKLVSDESPALTTIFVAQEAPARRVAALAKRVDVVMAPVRGGRLDLRWILRLLGQENVTSLLVEGGGEVNASFLEQDLAHRVAFFYAPKILGGREARKGVAGVGFGAWPAIARLRAIEWRRFGADLFMTATVGVA
jgi:diaminohydroxyphosphoribosylaminopyrimidine deaminase/5-amino-6-(5-phosphoribosylamino)uracil reductase